MFAKVEDEVVHRPSLANRSVQLELACQKLQSLLHAGESYWKMGGLVDSHVFLDLCFMGCSFAP